eukprot:PhM_4_TR12914/c0_g1_i1/m.53195
MSYIAQFNKTKTDRFYASKSGSEAATSASSNNSNNTTDEAVIIIRSKRNLNRKLAVCAAEGAWDNALQCLQKSLTRKAHTSWHYALVVAALVHGTSPATPNRFQLVDTLLALAQSGEIPSSDTFLRSCAAAYSLDPGKPDEAEQCLAMCSTPMPLSLHRKSQEVHTRIAEAYLQQGRWAESTRALRHCQDAADSRVAVLRQANVALSGDWVAALNMVTKSDGAEGTSSPFALQQAALGAVQSGAWEVALRVITANPTLASSGTVLHHILDCLGERGAWEAAMGLAVKSRQVLGRPADSAVHTIALVAASNAGAWERVLDYYWRCVCCDLDAEDVTHPRGREVLAAAMMEAGRDDAARQMLTRKDVVPSGPKTVQPQFNKSNNRKPPKGEPRPPPTGKFDPESGWNHFEHWGGRPIHTDKRSSKVAGALSTVFKRFPLGDHRNRTWRGSTPRNLGATPMRKKHY